MTGKKPVDYYQLIVSDSKVLEESNRQYAESHQDHLQSHSYARAHNFVKRRFAMSQLLRFLVLIITMGIVDLEHQLAVSHSPLLPDYVL